MLQQIVITGEGPTDMGYSRSGQGIARGDDFGIGPMGLLLLKQLNRLLPEWNRYLITWQQPGTFCTLVADGVLGKQSKAGKKIRPSKKVAKGYAEHAQRAAALAQFARENEQQLAVYFHDTDGTRSQLQQDGQRQQKMTTAIKEGFKTEQFAEQGIAMIPKPTSEAWLICALKEHPYQHCAELEQNLSGNDKAGARAPKVQLANILNNPDYNRETLIQCVEKLDPEALEMPSYQDFREQLNQAVVHLTQHQAAIQD